MLAGRDRGGRPGIMLPGLSSLRATVKVHVMVCAVIVILLTALYFQISDLEDRLLSLSQSSRMALDEDGTRWGPRPLVKNLETRRLGVPLFVKRIPQAEKLQPRPKPRPQPEPQPAYQDRPKADDRANRVAAPAGGDKVSRKEAIPQQANAKLPPDSRLTGIKKRSAAEVKRDDNPPMTDEEIAALSQTLEHRIKVAGQGHGVVGKRPCTMLAAMNNTRGTCEDRSCPGTFHPSAEHRVRELLLPYMQPTAEQRKLVGDIASSIREKRYIFVTVASSNHYNESQALVYSLNQHVFPKLQRDSYDFYYFDLGLKAAERRRVEKNCGCTVKTFPTSALPPFARHPMCYAWKPVIIKALLQKAEVVMYMDSSIRFQPGTDVAEFFAAARQWGAQFLASLDSIPNHTVNRTFGYYGDPPCLYWPYPELLAGFSVFSNEPFMNRVVLDPWLACAFNATCMCPVHPHAFRICAHLERRVGQCHRFDLSSLTLQMAKLYGDTFGHLAIRGKYTPSISRGKGMGYFKD